MTSTLGEILDRAGVSTLGVLDTQVDIPILTGPQAQGDLIVLPRPHQPAATTPIPQEGVAIVRSEAGGNTHMLHAWDGPCSYWGAARQDGDSGVLLGTLTVPPGCSAMIVHTEEHGANGIGPGNYVIHRQREQADVIRMVAD